MADTIMTMREDRVRIYNQARSFLDEKTKDGKALSAEDDATYGAMIKDIDSLGATIERLEAQARLDAKMKEPERTPDPRNPGAGNPGGGSASRRGSDEYQNAFWNMMRGDNDRAVRNALETSTDAKGGFLTPDEFERRIVEALEEENIFRSLATVIGTTSGERAIPVAADKGEAAWLDEGQEFPESDDSFGQIVLGAHKVGTLMRVSDELIDDAAFDLQSYIAQSYARRIGRKEEAAFLIGDGAKKPTGIYSGKGGAQIGVTTGAAALKDGDIYDLFYSLPAAYRNRAVFTMNDMTVKAIRKLKDSNGDYLLKPALQGTTLDTLFNRPVHTFSHIPEIAAGAKVMSFGDMSYYWIADRAGRVFRRLSEKYATSGQVGFMAHQRVDGKLILPEAVKLLVMGGTPAGDP